MRVEPTYDEDLMFWLSMVAPKPRPRFWRLRRLMARVTRRNPRTSVWTFTPSEQPGPSFTIEHTP